MNWHQKYIQIKICKQTKEVREELRNFSEKKEPLSDWIIEDLFDESILYDAKDNKKIYKNVKSQPRIGDNYQVRGILPLKPL